MFTMDVKQQNNNKKQNDRKIKAKTCTSCKEHVYASSFFCNVSMYVYTILQMMCVVDLNLARMVVNVSIRETITSNVVVLRAGPVKHVKKRHCLRNRLDHT